MVNNGDSRAIQCRSSRNAPCAAWAGTGSQQHKAAPCKSKSNKTQRGKDMQRLLEKVIIKGYSFEAQSAICSCWRWRSWSSLLIWSCRFLMADLRARTSKQHPFSAKPAIEPCEQYSVSLSTGLWPTDSSKSCGLWQKLHAAKHVAKHQRCATDTFLSS